MTSAPDDLLAVRRYVLEATALPEDAVGIVGDPDHASTGGYHEGNDDLNRVGRLSSDYSKRESSRDRPGTNAASALDIGDFNRGGLTLRALTLRFVDACQRGDPRTADVREVIYTPDGSTVRRWDRLGIRSTGDSSHLYHTHISFFRDSEGRRADPDNVLGLLKALIEGDDVALNALEAAQVSNTEHYLQSLVGMTDTASGISDTVNTNLTRPNELGRILRRIDAATTSLLASAAAEQARDVATRGAIDALATALRSGGGSVDSAAVIARIDEVAATESAAITQLHAELASARQEAAQLRERLAAALAPPAGG